jgi:hypothetical protein
LFKPFSIFILFICIQSNLFAQYFNHTNSWKSQRREYTFAGGVSNYMGDLGGLDRKGTNWFLFDLEVSQFKYGFMGSYRYNLNHRHASNISLFYGKVSGSDQLTGDIYRNNRNLSFTSVIWELSWNYEYYIIRPQPGHIYNIKGAKGLSAIKWDCYVFIGIGGFYYNPKAYGIPLRYMGTEGQGIPGSGKFYYSPIALSFPVGFGGSYYVTKSFKIGTEMAYRFTTTDYLDDVSTNYYDKEIIKQYKGELAAFLSDPSSGANPSWTAKGEQRGDPKYKDGFFSILVKITYIPKNKNKGERTKNKKRKIGFSTKKKFKVT